MRLQMFYGVIRDCDTGKTYDPMDNVEMSVLCKLVNENERKWYNRVKALEHCINTIGNMIRLVK